jgi:hypothetical protein
VWARVGASDLGGARIVRVARNPSEQGVQHGAGTGRGEQRLDVGLGPDVQVLAPFTKTVDLGLDSPFWWSSSRVLHQIEFGVVKITHNCHLLHKILVRFYFSSSIAFSSSVTFSSFSSSVTTRNRGRACLHRCVCLPL